MSMCRIEKRKGVFQMKKVISEWIVNYMEEVTAAEVESLLAVPKEKEMGDYSLPCFTLAKRYHQSPKMIAQEIKQSVEIDPQPWLKSVEAVNGYLNFYLEETWYYTSLLKKIVKQKEKMTVGQGKTICIDYSSPNIAKNFHIGHLRTTLIGHSLCLIYEKLGYHVVGINYLGDWGTQFGKLIEAYKLWGDKEKVEKDGLDELLRLYVKFHDEEKTQPELMEQARAWFAKMEKDDEEALGLWEWFKDISLEEFELIYQMLHITFDSYDGESCYRKQVSVIVNLLKEHELLTTSEGAEVVNLEEFEMPPCLITKSDGASIYPSRDLAAVLDRKQKYEFDQCLYVTGNEQQLHFNQVFHVIRKLGYDWWNQLKHISYGLISFQGGKLSTRSGNMVFAKDLLNEAVERAKFVIEEKNPELAEKEKTAQQVGIGAVIFHDLFHVRNKNISFDWDQVLNFDGATAPYIQYTYARACSVLKKNSANSVITEEAGPFYQEESSQELIKLLSGYQDVILEAAERDEPCVIARYAYQLAKQYNQFYQHCNVMNAPAETKEARIFLTSLACSTIEEAMGLLGIECPSEM